MSSDYIRGFVKTALAFNVNPAQLLSKARGLFGAGGKALRSRIGDRPVDAAAAAGKEFMRARMALTPLAAVPIVAST